jgi:hypothetical protein
MDSNELLEQYTLGERNFRRAHLVEANLNGAHLSGAHLNGADLDGADLAKADLTQADLRNADLNGAHLMGATLKAANLTDTNLTGANLTGANLTEAYFDGANLTGANLTDADLRDANLTGADLTDANLTGANLTGANLTGANLTAAVFTGAHLAESCLQDTILSDLDLGPLARGQVQHFGPSRIDWSAVVKSVNEPVLKDFLRRAGMPDVFVEYMVDCARSLEAGQVFSLLQSTFISYGGPDEAFARKLNDALERRGVTTFFFKDDAPPGEKLHRVMRKGVNGYDRTILICSEASLRRPGLLNELEETLAREARDGGCTYLIPVRLDDHVINGWAPSNPDLAQTVRDRVIADFGRHEAAAEFDAEVAKLIVVLKKPVAHR